MRRLRAARASHCSVTSVATVDRLEQIAPAVTVEVAPGDAAALVEFDHGVDDPIAEDQPHIHREGRPEGEPRRIAGPRRPHRSGSVDQRVHGRIGHQVEQPLGWDRDESLHRHEVLAHHISVADTVRTWIPGRRPPYRYCPGAAGRSAQPLRLYDTASGQLVDVTPAGAPAGLYVCGITPYDATHLGHAATYLAFDLINRVWRDQGYDVHYVQNVTDVDDPLLDRATRTGENWMALAERETQLFREDMQALRVLGPDQYIGAVEAISEITAAITILLKSGAAYHVDEDIYFSIESSGHFGYESNYDRGHDAALFAERGGDPDHAGKRDPLDSLLWRGFRHGEPFWDTELGRDDPAGTSSARSSP